MPTSRRCPSAWQPNLGRRSTYRRGNSVQTTGTTSECVSDEQLEFFGMSAALSGRASSPHTRGDRQLIGRRSKGELNGLTLVDL